MNNISNTLAEFRVAVKHAKAVLVVDEALKEIHDLENARLEARVAEESAQADRALAQVDLNDMKAAVATARAKVKAAEEKANFVKAESEAIAQETAKSGAKRAQELIDMASKQAVATRDRMVIQVQEHESKMRVWLEEEKKMEAEIGLITVELRELRKRIG